VRGVVRWRLLLCLGGIGVRVGTRTVERECDRPRPSAVLPTWTERHRLRCPAHARGATG